MVESGALSEEHPDAQSQREWQKIVARTNLIQLVSIPWIYGLQQ